MRKYIGLGETVYDIIFKDNQPVRAVPGGSAFNAMISLGRCRVPCCMVTEVGDDRVGSIVTSFLSKNGVDTSYVYRHEGTQSHISLAFLNDRNDAEYQFYKMHNALNMPERFPDVCEGDVVLFGSYFAINPKVRSVVSHFLRKAHDGGAVIYYDINFRASHRKDIPQVMSAIEENMSLSSVVRGSREDFSILFGLDEPQKVYDEKIRKWCDVFIYTDADSPVQVFTPQWRASFPAKKIDTVSTIGAGDNFNAGFCYGLNSLSIERTARLSAEKEETLAALVASGQHFSSHVCQSIENYVAKDFQP